MIDDEAPSAAAGRGDAGPGAARGPGAVAGEAQEERVAEKAARHGVSFGRGPDEFLQFLAIEQALQGAETLKELERVTRLLQAGELCSRPGSRRYAP